MSKFLAILLSFFWSIALSGSVYDTQIRMEMGGNETILLCDSTHFSCNETTFECFCTSFNVSNSGALPPDGEGPTIYYSEPLSYSLDYWIFATLPSKKRDGTATDSSTGMVVHLVDNTLILNKDFSPETCFLLVSTPLYHYSSPYSKEVILQNEIAYSSQVISTDVICNGEVVEHLIFQNFPVETCRDTFITDFHCLSVSMKVISVLGIVFIGSTLLVAIIALIYNIRTFQCSSAVESLAEPASVEEISSGSETGIDKIRTKYNKPKGSNPVLIFGILAVLVCSASACDHTIILSSGYTECLHLTDSTMQCSLRTAIDAPIPGMGAVLCLAYIDPVTASVVKTIKLSVIRHPIVLSLTQDYFSSDFSLVISSSKMCSGSTSGGVSCSGGFCTGLTSVFPTRRLCIPACGCAGCGCVSCNSGCAYVSYSLKPSGIVMKGSSVIQGSRIISTIFTDDSSQYILDFFDSLPQQKNNFTIQALSDWDIPIGLLSLHVVQTQESIPRYFILEDDQYSNFGAPQWNTFGSVQSLSVLGLAGTGYTIAQDDTIFYAGSSSISWANLPRSFPIGSNGFGFQLNTFQNYKGYSWVVNSTHLVGTPEQDVSTDFRISTNGNLNVQVQYDQICPVFLDDVIIMGCYNCPTGYSIDVSIKTSLYPGLVHVVNEEIEPRVISLTTEFQKFRFFSHSELKSISFSLLIQGTLCEAETLISTELNDPFLANGTIDNVQETLHDKETNQGFSNWWDSMTGTLSIYKYIFVSVVVLSAIAVLGILVFFGMKIFTPLYSRI